MIRINLLPVREARRQANMRRQGIALGAAAGVGIALCIVLQLWVSGQIDSHKRTLSARKAELTKLEKTRKVVKQFEREKAEIEAKLAVITQIEKARIGPVRVMDEIATRIPERVWLTSLNAQEGNLSLAGRSLDAEIVADFLTRLEESEMISDVQLQETLLKEVEGLKVNSFKLKGKYPHPKPPAATKAGKKGKKGKRKKGRR